MVPDPRPSIRCATAPLFMLFYMLTSLPLHYTWMLVGINPLFEGATFSSVWKDIGEDITVSNALTL